MLRDVGHRSSAIPQLRSSVERRAIHGGYFDRVRRSGRHRLFCVPSILNQAASGGPMITITRRRSRTRLLVMIKFYL